MRFNRMEIAGSLGDLGGLLPLGMGMVMINGLDASGMFFSIGLIYLYSAFYFRVTSPVQPMKVICAYAIATGIASSQILAATLMAAIFFLVIGITGIADVAGRKTPQAVVRGIQAAIGFMLIDQGARFTFGVTSFQVRQNAVEPYLMLQSLGPVPIGLLLGGIGLLTTVLLLRSRRYPAMLVLIGGGLAVGLFLGNPGSLSNLAPGIHPPEVMPFGFPALTDFIIALTTLVLPQIPMTLGNAVIAQADLSQRYFGQASSRVTYKSLCLSLAVANALVFLFGGMPLAHGAEGMAARYRFGARTAGSNVFIGVIFVVLAVIFGAKVTAILGLIPLSVLGVLLLLTGLELVLAFRDLVKARDLVIAGVVIVLTFFVNLTAGFVAGLLVAWLIGWWGRR